MSGGGRESGRAWGQTAWTPDMAIRFGGRRPGMERVKARTDTALGMACEGKVWYPKIDMRWLYTEAERETSVETGEQRDVLTRAASAPPVIATPVPMAPSSLTTNPTPPAASHPEPNPKQKPKTAATPPLTSLPFTMSPTLFKAALASPPGAAPAYFSYKLYRGVNPDGSEREVKVHYCKTRHTADRVMKDYFLDEPVIGFDLEWIAGAAKATGARRNVSLVQVASPGRVGLFHVALFPKKSEKKKRVDHGLGHARDKEPPVEGQSVQGKEPPVEEQSKEPPVEESKFADFDMPMLKKVLADPDVLKVGVNIKGDVSRVRDHLDMETKGVFELSHLYRLVKFCGTGELGLINKRVVALATQVDEFLRLPMFKGADIRSGDWTRPLSMDQVVCEYPREGTCIMCTVD